MIRRDIRLADGAAGWMLISQIEHARISAELAARCTGRFASSPQRAGPSPASLCDEVLAVTSFVYLGAAIIAFVALRTPLRKRAIGLAFLVDVLFCLGLILTAIACGLLVMIVL